VTRTYSHRVEILRGGARVGEIKSIEAPTIDVSATAAIKASMAGTFCYSPLLEPLQDELKIYLTINGVEYPMGVYLISNVRDEYEDGAHHISIEAYDRCYRVQQARTESVLHLSAGANYVETVKGLLTAAGIAMVVAAPTDNVLATDREDWQTGTDYLTIVNELLGEINYQELWFSADGYAMLQPINNPTAENVDHTYTAGEGASVLLPEMTAETDAYDKANVFVVICSNPDYPAPMVATAVNDSLLSPFSTVRRGRRITSVTRVNNIANQTELQAYAQRLMYESMMATETLTLRTAVLPGHGVNDVVAIIHPQAQGIYQEVGWSATLAPGQEMTHELRRSVIHV